MQPFSRSVTAEPEIQTLASLDHRRESADLGRGWFRDQTGRASLQLRWQRGDLSFVEDGVEEGAEPGEHQIRRAVEIDQLLGPFEAACTLALAGRSPPDHSEPRHRRFNGGGNRRLAASRIRLIQSV